MYCCNYVVMAVRECMLDFELLEIELKLLLLLKFYY